MFTRWLVHRQMWNKATCQQLVINGSEQASAELGTHTGTWVGQVSSHQSPPGTAAGSLRVAAMFLG